jgi:hypothetical protein
MGFGQVHASRRRVPIIVTRQFGGVPVLVETGFGLRCCAAVLPGSGRQISEVIFQVSNDFIDLSL